MVKDLNKKISSIEYNFLNLPGQINFSGTNISKNEYVYSAAGTKLSVIHKSTTEKRTDYVGNMIYENGSLKRILVDGGYIENGVYHFYIQDHLGNNRVVAKADETVVQTNHYYPYGMSFAEGTFADKQPYKYNGKELDTENGLNWYDYGARHYDTNLGRWHVVDPMAEEDYGLTPYNYCFNNPFKLIDPNGMWPGNPLLQPFARYQYGSNAVVNSFKFVHNTVAAIVNTPINIINQLADETGYIYSNGVGSYLSSGTQNIGDAISSELAYRVNTPISQQAADTWQSMKDPQNWENATATVALMLSPMKRSGTAGMTQPISVVEKGGTEVIGKNLLDVKDVLRIENAATKIGKPIHVVGSRASGKATVYSDWDYVIEGLTNKNWKSIKNSLPGAKSIIDNVPRNIDIIREPLDITKPYIKINPK